MASQADRRRQQNTGQPTAAPSSKIPESTPTSTGAPQGQPSQRIQDGPYTGPPEYGGPPPNVPAAPNTPGYVPQQGPPLPPQQNGPVFPPDPKQQVGYNGGYYNPTTAPYGYDMSSPGVQEQFWENNQHLWMQSPQLDWINSLLPQFEDPWYGEAWNQQNMGGIGAPGAGQQYWNSIAGQQNMMTPAQSRVSQGYTGKNRADEAFGQFKGAMPGSLQPAFDAYYDRMGDKAMSKVNSQAAARGVYGSNSALNNSIGAGIDVEAMRAKAGTDFSLADSANQLNWMTGLSNAGRAADLSGTDAFRANIDAAKSDLDRTKTLGDLAFAAEEMDLEKKKTQSDIAFGIDERKQGRLDSGISTGLALDQQYLSRLRDAYGAAGDAQNQREDRIGDLYDDVGGLSNDAANFFSRHYDKILGGDQALSDQEIQTMIAQMAQQQGWDTRTQERVFRDVTGFIDSLSGAKEADLI